MAASFSGIISALLMTASFYFTLSYFQYLKAGKERLVKQSKIGAVICLALGLLACSIFYV